MSRWADAFAELSGSSDTLDTMRHSAKPSATVSQSVKSVTAASETVPAERALLIWSEAEEERAAIIEHDGGISRSWSEGFARLDPDRPLGDVPPARWRRFVDDVGGFIDSPFCALAAAFNWGSLDLFGANRDRPFARIDQSGLLWLVNGGRVVMLAEDTAAIQTPNGARVTYRRNHSEPGRVLAWELVWDSRQ